jgi:hypothetical protein
MTSLQKRAAPTTVASKLAKMSCRPKSPVYTSGDGPRIIFLNREAPLPWQQRTRLPQFMTGDLVASLG